MGQGGLAQAGGAVEQDVVQRFVPAFGGGDADAQVVLDYRLPDEVIEAPWPQAGVQWQVFGVRFS
jgi:hypothetical protein